MTVDLFVILLDPTFNRQHRFTQKRFLWGPSDQIRGYASDSSRYLNFKPHDYELHPEMSCLQDKSTCSVNLDLVYYSKDESKDNDFTKYDWLITADPRCAFHHHHNFHWFSLTIILDRFHLPCDNPDSIAVMR